MTTLTAKFLVKRKPRPTESDDDSAPQSSGVSTLTKSQTSDREAWLSRATDQLWPTLHGALMAHGMQRSLPKIAFSCGFTGIGGRHSKRTGATWDAKASRDGTVQVFISPIIDSTRDVVAALCHEICHALVGPTKGHDDEFVRIAKFLGLVAPFSRPTAGHFNLELADKIEAKLGKYPHAAIDTGAMASHPELAGVKTQTTRMLKLVCPTSGYVIRTTRSWLDKHGAPISPVTKKPMQLAVKPSS